MRNDIGIVEKIRNKDATKQEQEIDEINTGVYVFDNKALAALHKISNHNAIGEYYLTDVIEILKAQGDIVAAYRMPSFEESMGVNDRVALSKATQGDATPHQRISHEQRCDPDQILRTRISMLILKSVLIPSLNPVFC